MRVALVVPLCVACAPIDRAPDWSGPALNGELAAAASSCGLKNVRVSAEAFGSDLAVEEAEVKELVAHIGYRGNKPLASPCFERWLNDRGLVLVQTREIVIH